MLWNFVTESMRIEGFSLFIVRFCQYLFDNLFVREFAIVEFILKFHDNFCFGFDAAYLAVKLQNNNEVESHLIKKVSKKGVISFYMGQRGSKRQR